jgi:hypothetical protein
VVAHRAPSTTVIARPKFLVADSTKAVATTAMTPKMAGAMRDSVRIGFSRLICTEPVDQQPDYSSMGPKVD